MKRTIRQQGFTLVEMMIALVVGAIVAAAAYQVLVNQGRTYEVQDQSLTMQRNARAALDFVCQELRHVGYGVESDDDVLVKVINNNQEDDNGVALNTDSISFVANTIEASIIATDAAASATTISVQAAPNLAMEFRAGDVVDILDWNKRSIIEGITISGVSAALGSYTDLTVPAISVEVKAGYLITREPEIITYRLKKQTNTAWAPVLERRQGPLESDDFLPLIDDVEDFQLVYAFDNDGDNEIDVDGDGNVIWAVDSDDNDELDLRVKDDGTTEALTELVEIGGNPRECKLRAVRISILVRTARGNPDHRFQDHYTQPAVEDHDNDDAGTDGYRRCLLQRIIKFRDVGLG